MKGRAHHTGAPHYREGRAHGRRTAQPPRLSPPARSGLSTAIAVTANTDSADPAVSRFLDAVWMERGLSPNTLAAYRADLTALARWLEEREQHPYGIGGPDREEKQRTIGFGGVQEARVVKVRQRRLRSVNRFSLC